MTTWFTWKSKKQLDIRKEIHLPKKAALKLAKQHMKGCKI